MSGKTDAFTIGVSGHRDLSRYDVDLLRDRVRHALGRFRRDGRTCRMLNSLAEGADQLCAEAALELGYKLICPLPFDGYRGDFSGEALECFDRLLGCAADSFYVSVSSNRDAAYLAAGQYVAGNCDVLLAVWDGEPQKSNCGTEAAVQYAESLKKDVLVLAPGEAQRAGCGRNTPRLRA